MGTDGTGAIRIGSESESDDPVFPAHDYELPSPGRTQILCLRSPGRSRNGPEITNLP